MCFWTPNMKTKHFFEKVILKCIHNRTPPRANNGSNRNGTNSRNSRNRNRRPVSQKKQKQKVRQRWIKQINDFNNHNFSLHLQSNNIAALQLILKKFKKIKLINDKNRFDDDQLNSMFDTAYQHYKTIEERIKRLRLGESDSSSGGDSSGNDNDQNDNETPEPSPTVSMEDNDSKILRY